MRRLDRYIVSTVASAIILVMVVVLSLDLVFGFVAEIEDIKGNYQVVDALIYIFMTLPRRIYDYLPLGAFMGCLIGLGALAKNSELTVIRAAGVSIFRIAWAAMKPTFIVVLMSLALGEFVAPLTEKIAQSQKALKRGAESGMVVGSGLWHKEGDSFVHINAVEPNGALYGVSINYYDDSQILQRSVFAKRAIYERQRWQLIDVEESRFAGEGVSIVKERVASWPTALTPELLNILVVKPDNLSISGLHKYVLYLSDLGLSSGIYELAFWKKALQPFSTVVLVFVAVSFVFGPMRSVAIGSRVFAGLLVGLSFKYVQDLLGPSSLVFGFEPIFASLTPSLICVVIGLYLLRRAG